MRTAILILTIYSNLLTVAMQLLIDRPYRLYVATLHSMHIIVTTCPSWMCSVSLLSTQSDLIKTMLIKTQADTSLAHPYSGHYHDKSMVTPNCAENRLAIKIIQSVK